MAHRDNRPHPWQYIKSFAKWSLLGLLMGAIGGCMGAFFHHTLHFVTHLRQENGWLIWLLPLAGLLTVGLYRVTRLRSNRGTNEIIDAVLDGHPVKPQIAPVIFCSTKPPPYWTKKASRSFTENDRKKESRGSSPRLFFAQIKPFQQLPQHASSARKW